MWLWWMLACPADPERAKVPESSPPTDDSGSVPAAEDLDGDGHPSTSDCNDDDAQINPDRAEVCDGLDNNCDSRVDEVFADFAVDVRETETMLFEGDAGNFGTQLLSMPDLDQDYAPEWVMSAPASSTVYMFERAVTPGSTAAEDGIVLFGPSGSAAGSQLIDLGWQDLGLTRRTLLISAPEAYGGEGRVYLVDTTDDLTIDLENEAWSISGSDPDARLGASVTGPTDLNTDGVGDLVVSAPGSGAVYVAYDAHFIGSIADADRRIDVGTDDGCGTALASGNTYYDDDYPWLAIACPGHTERSGDEGAVWVLSGAFLHSAPNVTNLDELDAVMITTTAAGALLGTSLTTNTDASGGDLVIGAPGDHEGRGGIYRMDVSAVRAGNMPSSLVLSDAVVSWEGPDGVGLGHNLSGAGDLESDGAGELIAGINGGTCPIGSAWLLAGGSRGSLTLPDPAARSYASGDADFGAAVALADDPWSDAVSLMVAAPMAGRVYVFAP